MTAKRARPLTPTRATSDRDNENHHIHSLLEMSLARKRERLTEERERVADELSRLTQFPCSDCTLGFENKSSLGRHKRLKHPKDGKVAVRFPCQHCSMTFQRPEGAKNHLERGHRTVVNARARVLDANRAIAEHRRTPVDGASAEHSLAAAQFTPYFRHGLSEGQLDDTVGSGAVDKTDASSIMISQDSRLTEQARSDIRDANICLEPYGPPEQFYGAYGQSLGPRSRRGVLLPDDMVSRTYDSWRQSYENISHRGVRGDLIHRLNDLDTSYDLDRISTCQSLSSVQDRDNEATENFPPRCRTPFNITLPGKIQRQPEYDLEVLLRQQDRRIRHARTAAAFRLMHGRLSTYCSTMSPSTLSIGVAGEKSVLAIMDEKQAWQDGVGAARKLLDGALPRELRSVLGLVQVADAMRSAVDDLDSEIASKDKFLSDIGRWRQLLPDDTHAFFDSCADVLWGSDRPPSDLAWQQMPDVEKLAYFQALLEDLLTHVDPFPANPLVSHADGTLVDDGGISTSSMTSMPAQANIPGSQAVLAMCQESSIQHGAGLLTPPTDYEATNRSASSELALYAAGAVSALILVFMLLHLGASVQILSLCLMTDRDCLLLHNLAESIEEHRQWLVHQSLSASCQLIELLLPLLHTQHGSGHLEQQCLSYHGPCSWWRQVSDSFEMTLLSVFPSES